MARFVDWIRGFFAKGDFIDIRSAEFKNTIGEIYYKELAIRQAVSIIAGVISKCEFKVFYNGKAAEKSEEYFCWNVSPNDNQNAVELKAKIVEELLLTGEALVFESGGSRFCADSFNIEKDGVKPYKFTNVTVDNVTLGKTFKRKDVLYFKLGQCNITNLIDRVFDSYGNILSAAITSGKNAGGSKWKLKISTLARNNPNFKQTYENITKNNLKSFFESFNAVYPEFEGYELVRLPSDSDGAKITEITELRKDIFSMVANAYKIPLSIFNGGQASEIDKKQFQSECIEYITEILNTELSKQMFTKEQWQKGNYFEIDTTNIESLAIDKLAGAAEKLIGSGLMNIDEVRVRILGLNALNTEQSTKYWITRNFADIKEMNAEATGGENE